MTSAIARIPPKKTAKQIRGPYKTGSIRRTTEGNILTAAIHVFSIKGFNGASISAVALHANVPKANIYYYFKSKVGLYQAVLQHILQQWDLVLNQWHQDDDPATVLCHYIEQKMAFSRCHPQESRVFAKEMLSGAPYLKDYLGSAYSHWFQSRTAIFEHWIEQGKIAPIDPRHLLFMMWASTQHYADFAPQIKYSLQLEELTEDTFRQATESIQMIVLRACGLM